MSDAFRRIRSDDQDWEEQGKLAARWPTMSTFLQAVFRFSEKRWLNEKIGRKLGRKMIFGRFSFLGAISASTLNHENALGPR